MESPWAVILCKFNDDASEPFPMQYYQDLFTPSGDASQRDMVRYFADYSHGKLDLGGSKVFGWYSLDKSVDDYNALQGGARPALLQWARAAATADGVDLLQFSGVVACTNLWEDIGAAQGGPLAGVVSQGFTAQPQLLAHEMGHVYGMNHSRIDGSTEDYKDPWDIMSAATTYSAPDPHFKVIGPGLNAWNMRSRDWLDESRVWKAAGPEYDQTVVLRPLVSRELPGWLAAEIPGGFLVEFRTKDGWDAKIPRPAVLVHRFDMGVSYLMRGNMNNADLIAGDSFGNAVPGDDSTLFQRVDVISIDAEGGEAVLRIRGRRLVAPPREDPIHLDPRAIDPIALVLSTRAYLILMELKHPHVPKVADVREAVRGMAPHEQAAALSRARALIATGRVVEEAMGAGEAPRQRGNLVSRFFAALSRLAGG